MSTTENKLPHTNDTIKKFTLESLQAITNNFSEKNIIGHGGYGTVYKGVLDNGEEIALKKLHSIPRLDDMVFSNEFSNLRKAQHKNITRLVGYCYHTGHQIVEHNGKDIFVVVEERVLCIEYLQNGSLDKYLSDESCGLDWCTRYKIINGVCEGLNYLHTGYKDPIYHLDLKPANILLDADMTPKIGDFGLSRFFPAEHNCVTQKTIGTPGYMPPEYIERGEITNKFDVFSLGVIIIKVIAGNIGYSTCPNFSSQQFVEHVHENWRKRLGKIMSSRTSEEVTTCLEIALECVEVDRLRRPTISEVVNKINSVNSSPISGIANLRCQQANNKYSVSGYVVTSDFDENSCPPCGGKQETLDVTSGSGVPGTHNSDANELSENLPVAVEENSGHGGSLPICELANQIAAEVPATNAQSDASAADRGVAGDCDKGSSSSESVRQRESDFIHRELHRNVGLEMDLSPLIGIDGGARGDQIAAGAPPSRRLLKKHTDPTPSSVALDEVDFVRWRVQSSAGAACSDTAHTCVKQVRDLACELEDCLLDLTLYETSRASWLRWAPPDLAASHRVADRIRDLQASLVQFNQTVAVEEHSHADDVYQLTPGDEHQDIKRNKEMDDLAKLVSKQGAGVVSVWGMGGMGKSSLVRMLYNDTDLIDGFEGRAWVTVPHPLDSTNDLERWLSKQLGVKDLGVSWWLEVKRCLVVVDDVSSHEEWELISRCLGVGGANDTGSRSRVVVTTRREDVARLCAGDVYELRPLNDEEARKLLCQKVYKNADYKMMYDTSEQANRILRVCRGLPLTIATIGGLLANKPKTSRGWMNLRWDLGSELEFDRDIRRIITSSYDGLPYHLKSCFLYLSIFPENHEIRLTRLLRRWMAEGYITEPRDMSMEEAGRRYYDELISRSMIQPSEKARASMGVEHCRVHGVVLQIILSKFIKENQLFIVDKHCNEAPQTRIRHLVVIRWKSKENMTSIDLSHVRSLTIFGRCPPCIISSKLRLLIVLDLEDTVELKNDDLKHIGELHHLKYLGLRKTNISRLPSSLQNLRYLETLDVQDTMVTQLPVGITKLEKLRHLVGGINYVGGLIRKNKVVCNCNDNLFDTMAGLVSGFHGFKRVESPCSCCAAGFSVTTPESIEKLRNLEVLGVVHIAQGSKVARNLENLTSLRRLGVDVAASEQVERDLCRSVARLARLERLEMCSESLEFLLKGTEESPPKHLTSLRLSGRLGKLPDWMSSLNDLGKVKLLRTQLKQADIEVMGNLPNLTLLALLEESFAEGYLRFGEGTFQKLNLLYIEGLQMVKTIQIEDGALRELQKLEVKKCISLDDSEAGLFLVLFLKNLNELVLTSCGDKPRLEEALQRQIFDFAKRPKLITGKSIVTSS